MKFNDDDERNDYFDGPDLPDETKPEKKSQKTRIQKDNPLYWDQDESHWEHLHVSHKRKFWIIFGTLIVLCGLAIAFWLRFFSPYIEDATTYGYVDNIEKRGTIFKTYEGALINYKELHDTTRLYSRDFIFSVSDSKIATFLKKMQLDGKPVRVSYKVYHATVPWRGASKTQIVAADSVDPSKILPPEFR